IGIMGVMQLETQEKRQWLSKQQFVEGLALVNMLPGLPGFQLAIFLGHAKGALIGGILAGLCLILPAFFYVLAVSTAYVAFGSLPTAQSAFYGIAPVVIGIFAASVYKLGRNVQFWQWTFHTRLHSGPSRQPVWLADAERIHRPLVPRSTDTG